MSDSDAVTVGDLKSSARGSGARKNAGKPQWWQLPLFAVTQSRWLKYAYAELHHGPVPSAWGVLQSLAEWQRGDSGALMKAIAELLAVLADEHVMRWDQGVPLRAFKSTMDVLEFGAKKYPACAADKAVDAQGRPTPESAGNWAKGMPWSVCLSCALSHLFSFAGGEAVDSESGLSHLAHAMCNLLFLKSYETLYPEGDDRIIQYREPAQAAFETDVSFTQDHDSRLWGDSIEKVTGDFA